VSLASQGAEDEARADLPSALAIPAAAQPVPAPIILVIDDDPAVCELLDRFLSKEGFVVRLARTGEAGLQAARELRPAVITLDVNLPDIQGWTVLTTLKADAQLADIPVVMLTTIDDKQQGYTLGAVEYLTKPVNREQLVSLLRSYARLRRQQGASG
jgi:DNA-binding response OmpR family regulator